MLIKIKVNILKKPGMPIMGPGPFRLLERIKAHRSISQAARSMNLSYVKALNILNRLEKSLGRKILIRRRGGSDRGGTELTPYAEFYLDHYRRLEERIMGFAETEFQSFLEEL